MLTNYKKILFSSIVSVLIALQACTVKYSTTGASIPPEMKTVTIIQFENRSNNVQPQLSFNLTELLRKKIRQNTSLKIVSDGGDAIFEGTITGYDVQPTSITSKDEAAKNRFTVTVKVKFTNNIEPALSYETSFSRYRDYSSDLSFESGTESKLPDIMDELTEDIFNKAFVNW